MRLLCLADIHLGRQPARLPDALRERVGARALGPAGGWERAVEYAIDQRVEAVLLAGDVVEQEDDFHEAYPDLLRGVQRLTEAGIRVLGIAGNHDVQVLPRLAESVASFELLGRDGSWQAAQLDDGAGTLVSVLGWSFPEPVVRDSPLAQGLPKGDKAAKATIGLLHCDRDQSDSRHAPVSSRELENAPVDAWLLGHIHKPDDLSGERPIGYLGSLTGLDPGEPGPHGPWLMEIGRDGGPTMHQVPLAPLRWEELEIPVDTLDDPADVHDRIMRAIGELHDGLARLSPGPDAVGCRLRLTGRTSLRAALERTLHADDPRGAPHERDGIVYFVHDWRLETLPAIDLDELARGRDPAALLARKLLVLRGGDSEARRELIAGARERLAAVPQRRYYSALGAEPPGDEEIAEILEAAGRRGLDDLLSQGEDSG